MACSSYESQFVYATHNLSTTLIKSCENIEVKIIFKLPAENSGKLVNQHLFTVFRVCACYLR